MDPEHLYGNRVSDMLLGYADNPGLIAEPLSVSNLEDIDLSRVKQELPEPTVDFNCLNTMPLAGQCDDVKPYMTKPATKAPSKRGRKPQLTAYGKSGEKLEKRREQNRRAAATYREKQRQKRRVVEESYLELEEANKRQRKANEELMKLKEHYEAILKSHQHNGPCFLGKCEGNALQITGGHGPFANFNTASNNNTLPLNWNSGLNNIQFENPMVTIRTEVTSPQNKDQTVAPSPYTPKSDQVFLFEGWDAKAQQAQAASPPLRAHSPASVLSSSPAPEPMFTAKEALPAISTVINTAQNALEDPFYYGYHMQAVDEFLDEHFTEKNL